MTREYQGSLLLDEPPLLVLPTLAARVGLHESIILQQIHYWVRAGAGEVHEGRRWVYNSYPGWQKQFPFLSEFQIGRAMRSLEEQGLLVSGNFNRSGLDKTKWYAIDYDKLKSLEAGQDPPDASARTPCKNARPSSTNAQPSFNSAPPSRTHARPIPEITTETTSRETLPSSMEGNAGTFGRGAHDASPQGSEREVAGGTTGRVKVVDGEWNDFSGESEPSEEITPNPQPSAPNEFYNWQIRLLESSNPLAVMVEFIDRFYPRQIRTWKAKGVNPFTAVGRLRAQKNPNALPDWKTTMKYLWRAFAEQPDEDLISYTQRLYTRDRARLRNMQAWSDGSTNGPREL
ncbi:MAG: hypothetical protein HY675_14485 [Chloroflexi bacterium]|nr:hypothetical protein [Chloroflexota bacterium]